MFLQERADSLANQLGRHLDEARVDFFVRTIPITIVLQRLGLAQGAGFA